MTLAARDIAFAYRRARPVLRGVSCDFAPGRLAAILGPNGCGKSTLLRLLAGVRAPDAGRVTLDGSALGSLRPAARARRLAYIAQRPSVAGPYSVRDVVAMGRHASPRGADDAVRRALERLELAGRADEPFNHLSAGEQQRAALARARAQLDGVTGARAILADEPAASMDPRHALDALSVLRDAARAGAVVVVVLHDVSLASRFADDALVLSPGGAVIAAGPAEAALTPDRLREAFDVAFVRVPGPDPGGWALLPAGPIPRT